MAGNYSYNTSAPKKSKAKDDDRIPPSVIASALGGIAEDTVGLAQGGAHLGAWVSEGLYGMFNDQPLDTSGFVRGADDLADFFDVRKFDYVNNSMDEYPTVAAVAPYIMPAKAVGKSLFKLGKNVKKLPESNLYRWFEGAKTSNNPLKKSTKRVRKTGTKQDIAKVALKRSVLPAAAVGGNVMAQDRVSDFNEERANLARQTFINQFTKGSNDSRI